MIADVNVDANSAGLKIFKASALQMFYKEGNAFSHLLGLKNALDLKRNTPQGAFKIWVVMYTVHVCNTEKA